MGNRLLGDKKLEASVRKLVEGHKTEEEGGRG